MKNFDARRNLFLVEDNGTLVAYAGCRWRQEINGDFVYDHWRFGLPEWRGQGIENELLHCIHQRLSEYAADHPHDATKWFETETADTQPWINTVLKDDGYQPVRYFYEMVRENLEDIPVAELPAGIETRPAKPEHMRQIFFGGEEAFAEHWGCPVVDETDFELWLKKPWNPALWQIAWDSDEFVGMILNHVDESENKKYGYKRGYTEDIAVRKPWRGRGIAKALLVRSLKMFREMGFDSTALGVDTENASGALHLYESVGYKTVRTFAVYRKPF
jgi:mycothiol synthase